LRILYLRARGRAAGFQRGREPFDPSLSPEYLAVEHIDPRAETIGCQRFPAILQHARSIVAVACCCSAATAPRRLRFHPNKSR
jgi:hypothetical protein